MAQLDSPKVTIERRSIILNKKYLYRVYMSFYRIFKTYSKKLPKGKMVELGSGAGFLKEVIPSVITSDVLKLPFCDMKFPAEKIPFKNSSVSVFYLLNTFHHIKNPKKALSEMERCLKRKGKIIMVEPANTPLAKFIYTNFHHEYFSDKENWSVRGKGALSDSNHALAWIIFVRDRKKFQKLFPNLKITKYETHTPLNYLVSGGFKYPSLLPPWAYTLIEKTEFLLKNTNKTIGLFST